jgi:hypothetical protein
MRWVVVEWDDSLGTYLGRKLESVSVGAVPPADAARIFLLCVLSVVNQQISIEGEIIARNPVRGRPPIVRENQGRFMIREIDSATAVCLNAIPHSGTRMANERASDSERANAERGARHFMTDNSRQVTKVHWKQGRRQVSRKAAFEPQHTAGRPPNVDINIRVIERAKEAEPLYVIHVEMSKKNVDPSSCSGDLRCQSADARASVQNQ